MSTKSNATGGNAKRTVLRGALFVSLLAAAAICAGVSYTQLRDSEDQVAVEAFNSLAEGAAHGAQQIASQRASGASAIALYMSTQFPDGSDWPFINEPSYMDISSSVAELSGALTQSVIVRFAPDQLNAVNEHAKEHYEEEGRPETAGVNGFGFGVWKPDAENDPTLYDDGRLPVTDASNNWGGKDPNLYALLLHNAPPAPALLYNPYSEASRGVHIDAMNACAEARPDEDSNECYVVTDMLKLKGRADPAGSLLFHPIYPKNEPGNVVGFAAVTFDWASMFVSTVPTYVDGLVCVVETKNKQATWEIVDGKPNFIGEGDLHDSKYDEYKFGPVPLLDPSSATSSASYKLTLYPSEVMFSEFQSNTPTVVAVSLVVVICVVAGLFILYDMLVRKQIRELEAQAERYKKQFAVRMRRSSVDLSGGTKNSLEALFDRLDKNSDGTIDKAELKEYVEDSIQEKDFEAMWSAIDMDGNGTIEYDEFCHFMAEVGLLDIKKTAKG